MAITFSSRRQVGKTTLSLPPLGFGSAHLGGMYERVSESDSQATIRAAWDGGIRYFDTAPFYGRGLSEHRIGSFLLNQARDEFVIATKVGRKLTRPPDPRSFDRTPWPGGLNFEVSFDYTYDGVMRSYEHSLSRLGLDTVDALLIHDPDAVIHGEIHSDQLKDMAGGGIRALEKLKSGGEIKAIGMGLNFAESLDTIAPLVPLDFVIVAMPYTLLDQTALHTGMKRCIDNDISIVIGAPFASGILATGPGPTARYRYGIAPPDVQERVQRIGDVCAGYGVSLQSAALQFPLAHPAVISIIPGGARPAEVAQNIASIQAPVPNAFWQELKSEGLLDQECPTPG
jgi:D-threo-aldose 1-dehydrogenase